MNGRTILTGHWAAVEMMEAGQWPAERDSSEDALTAPAGDRGVFHGVPFKSRRCQRYQISFA